MSNTERTAANYQELHRMTLEACSRCPAGAYSCCIPDACAFTEREITQRFNMYLPGPYLTSTGCKLPPYMRRMCTLHICHDALILQTPEWQARYKELVKWL